MMQPIEHVDADIAIVGSGFAGSLTALCLRRRGFRVAIVERGRHPRFAIGESSTPLANLLIEELADRYDLPRIRPFSKWGTWQRERPDVAGGLKRGFTFFFHRFDEPFPDDRDRARQLLVAASPHDAVGDTHWYRPAFDHALVKEAESEGAIHLDETQLHDIRFDEDGATIEGTRGGRSVRISASFVIDASGPRGFLHRALGLGERPFRWLPGTQGLYTHFEGVARWDTLRAAAEVEPPYPVDDAALHHVFPGGWIWMLRFNNGITSAGTAITDPAAAAVFQDARDETGWRRLLDRLPSVREQFREARAVHPFIYTPRVAFRSARVSGDRWALLPSAAGVIDPLLSTGFPLTLLGITRLVDLLEHTMTPRRSAGASGNAGANANANANVTAIGDTPAAAARRGALLREYEQATLDELDITEQLVAALYANMTDPALFKRLGLLYFAAASFSEAARRLGRPALVPGFLLHAHPRFGRELRACAAAALAEPEGPARDALCARIDEAIEPFDTAGLLDRTRRDWYAVRADDLIANASKLEATADEIHRLLERCGFTPAVSVAK